MKKHSLISILLVLSVGFISVNAEAAFTVAVPEPAIVCLLGLGHWVCQEDEKLGL
jgi:hypothetical protein